MCKGVFLRVAASDRVLDMWEGGRTTKQSFKELKVNSLSSQANGIPDSPFFGSSICRK